MFLYDEWSGHANKSSYICCCEFTYRHLALKPCMLTLKVGNGGWKDVILDVGRRLRRWTNCYPVNFSATAKRVKVSTSNEKSVLVSAFKALCVHAVLRSFLRLFLDYTYLQDDLAADMSSRDH